MTRPTLHLTNWSSRKLHGPGLRFGIMARPRRWEHGDGKVLRLIPDANEAPLMLRALADRANVATMLAYRDAIEARWAGDNFLVPWRLVAMTTRETSLAPAGEWIPVRDGDSILCACAVGAECHRRWAAPFLVRAGWRVLLDGVEVVL